MKFEEAMERATEAVRALNHAFAAAVVRTADEMTDAEAEDADQLMRENPELGYLDAAAEVMAKAGSTSSA